jgi:hypothetical protein
MAKRTKIYIFKVTLKSKGPYGSGGSMKCMAHDEQEAKETAKGLYPGERILKVTKAKKF